MAFDSRLLDGVVIFAEVATKGSFTQAARNSGHSTSYISKEINKLEARLGVRLLHRTTRSLSLTPEGEAYLQQCQQIIQDAQQAENTLGGGKQEPSGGLRVSCPISFGLSRVRPVLASFMEQYPKVSLDLDLNDRKVDLVAEGFDVVIRGTGQMEDSSLISRRLLQSRILTVASPGYLQKYGTPTAPADLESHQAITYSYMKHPNLWVYQGEENTSHRVQVQSRVVTNSSEMELALCLAGQGIIRLPDFYFKGEIERGDVVELFQNLPPQYIDLYLMYPSRKHMSLKVRSFIDFVIRELGDTSGG